MPTLIINKKELYLIAVSTPPITIKKSKVQRVFLLAYALLCSALIGGVLTGCGGDSNSSISNNSAASVAYVKRNIGAIGNPTEATRFAPGGDLYLKPSASVDATSFNVTQLITSGVGDVSDPEPSFDGTRIIFSVKKSADETWDLWQYDTQQFTLTPVLLNSNHDDIDPAYLPDGRIVFSSNRQQRSQTIRQLEGYPQSFKQLDEYQREPIFNLHVFDPSNGAISQISFNQSHDLNPSVMQNGKILFSRWEHFGDRNQYSVYTINPDGTDLSIYYGAHSPGDAFLHPREAENGRLVSSVMPLTQTFQGGGIVDINTENHDEAFILNSASTANLPLNSDGQHLITPEAGYRNALDLSPQGRYTTPFPLWNGSGNLLASYSVSRPVETVGLAGQSLQTEGEPFYNLALLNPQAGTQEIIETTETGYALLDGIALIPRSLPTVLEDTVTLQDFFSQTPATVSIRSVYDTDFMEHMGQQVLVNGESIPSIVNSNPAELRSQVADILSLKDPLATPPDSLPAKFVRVTKAVPTPPALAREVVGHTQQKMRQILGYSPVEPDGSVKFSLADLGSNCSEEDTSVSAIYGTDSPLEISVVDAKARALQLHSSWLQVRPGEHVQCNGCHSPRHGQPINNDPITNYHPNVIDTLQAALGGETMAESRDRVRTQSPDLATELNLGPNTLSRNIAYQDIWSDPTISGIQTGTPFANNYTDLITDDPDALLSSTAMSQLACGIINYPDHIQPLWAKTRGVGGRYTCRNCHDGSLPAGGLAIPNSFNSNGRFNSYDNLLLGRPELDEGGAPILFKDENGLSQVQRTAPLVRTGNNVASGLARGSHLLEVLTNTELKAPQALAPIGQRTDHSVMMSEIELRLISEWIDIGAQYYNRPYDENGAKRGLFTELDELEFTNEVLPVLTRRCGSCHAPQKGTLSLYDGNQIEEIENSNQPRFILTGQPLKDYYATLALIDNITSPQITQLLRRATESNHPGLPDNNGILQPILTELDDDYAVLYQWILISDEDL